LIFQRKNRILGTLSIDHRNTRLSLEASGYPI